MAQEAGLYVIARPGPYINAETDGGGIPSWVLTSQNGYRSDVQPYLSAALQWLVADRPDHRRASGHQGRRRHRLPGGERVRRPRHGRRPVHGRPRAAGHVRRHRRAVHVQPVLRRADIHLRAWRGEHQRHRQLPAGVRLREPGATSASRSPAIPSYPGEPVYLPEYQGGSFDGWGGAGYDDCYDMTGPDFENVYYKDNIIQGSTMQSYYMGVGGTNWGWLPAPQVYTSYDYGAAIRETGEIGTPTDPNDIAGSKYGENKLINDLETSVAPLTQTVPAQAPAADNPAITTLDRVNPSSGTQFVYVRQSDATSTATASTHIALSLTPATSFTDDDASSALTYTGTWTHANTGNSNYTSRRLRQHRVVEPAGRRHHVRHVHRDGRAVDRAEEHQWRHRRRVHRRHSGCDRRHLRLRRQGVPADPVQHERPGERHAHAHDHGDRDQGCGLERGHGRHRRHQRAHRRRARRLLPAGTAVRHDHARRARLAAARRQLRLRRPAPGLLDLRAHDPGDESAPATQRSCTIRQAPTARPCSTTPASQPWTSCPARCRAPGIPPAAT